MLDSSPIFSIKPNVIFLSETAIGYGGLPLIPGYTTFADKMVQTTNHGGLVMYIKSKYAPHVFDILYKTCYISFRLDFCPQFVFIGVYIQPESSKYFSNGMFADISAHLIDCTNKLLTTIIGGDFNSRPGNFYNFCNMNYAPNKDQITNSHGTTYFTDLCNIGNVFPINHLKYKGKQFPGKYTYHKSGKNSQIDFVLTNKSGLQNISLFSIVDTNWHLSDHLPLHISMDVNENISACGLYRRACDLNYEFDPNKFTIKRYTKQYNNENMKDFFEQNRLSIENSVIQDVESNRIESAITHLNEHLERAHQQCRVTNPNTRLIHDKSHSLMVKANNDYENYQKALSNEHSSEREINSAQLAYAISRKALTSDILTTETNKWQNIINSTDSKKLWNKINWKGELNNKPIKHPMIDDLQAHFQTLYSVDDQNESLNIANLTSNMHVPILDDPISLNEIDEAVSDMKKGGYDYKLPVIKILTSTFLYIITLLMNCIFFLKYPANLACSLLLALPKKGNLMLSRNYRGIQMLPALGVLYDRILTNRLNKWIGVEEEQTAFQKGKSTIHQLFTIRILIALAYYCNITLYIGLFDLEKAFDKISRCLLLKKLIKLGIGRCMLNALKLLYLPTYCILSFYGQFSELFETCTGIRQGAASSVLLFIVFINDLIIYLKSKCVDEPLIDNLHCLLHADDTAILSTERSLFIRKCNYMLEYLNENKLGLNLGKSGYLIINGKDADTKSTINLNNGSLKYKKSVIYLGAIISDSGNINNDIQLHINDKRSNVTVKFTNFCSKNIIAPIMIKLKVLNTCVAPALTYACETWGKVNNRNLESIYRTGLKTALGVRNCTNNEIVYIESGSYPLTCTIQKQQMKFWNNIKVYTQNQPDAPLSKLLQYSKSVKLPYIMHYIHMNDKYESPEYCYQSLTSDFATRWSTKIRTNIDENSKLGAYLKVNRDLTTPDYNKLFEIERISVTQYRTGSHNLMIELGRYTVPTTPREERLCKCNEAIQTLEHCTLYCPLLVEARKQITSKDLFSFIKHEHIHQFLITMERTLRIKKIIL